MDRIKVLIADDELQALELVKRYVLRTPFLELVHECRNGLEAMSALQHQKVDVAFLDIQMPGLTGIELSRLISSDVRVIFTTAFSEYALEGFKVNAMDYLLKPFSYEEFLHAALKAKEWFDLKSAVLAPKTGEKEFLYFKADYKQHKVALKNVIMFEGLKDYVKIWIEGQPRPMLSLITLKSLEQELPVDKFMRIHRSYIVSLAHIDAVERGQVLIGNQRITVADQYKERFNHYLNNHSVV